MYDQSQPESILRTLRQLAVLEWRGTPPQDARRQLGVTDQTWHRWQDRYSRLSREATRTADRDGETVRLRAIAAGLGQQCRSRF
jgi:transposase-like protein